MIDEETGQNFDYTSSIDENTYNKIKLTYDNKDTGKRDVYITQDSSNINKWGILQYFDTLQKGENGQAKADALYKSLYGPITPNVPASILQLHPDVTVVADEGALKLIREKGLL